MGKDSIESLTIKPQSYEEKIIAVGLLGLAQETSLTAEVSGVVKAVSAKPGDPISAGERLIEIDDQDQGFQLAEKQASYLNAEAQYNQLIQVDYLKAKAELSKMETQKQQAETAYDNAKQLYAEGAISKTALDDQKFQYESVLAQWNAAKLNAQSLNQGGAQRSAAESRVQAAKAVYDQAADTASNFQIKAPWDSVLLKTYVEPQDYVQAGQILADIGAQGGYYVTTELDEKYFPYLKQGMTALISVGEDKAGEVKGTVDTITPKINENTGTFEVRIAMPAEFPYQASNLTVNIEILLQSVENGIAIPKEYLIQEDGTYVFLYKKGTIEKSPVEVVAGPGGRVLVEKGLSADDIIVKPVPGLKDGDAVKVSEGDAA